MAETGRVEPGSDQPFIDAATAASLLDEREYVVEYSDCDDGTIARAVLARHADYLDAVVVDPVPSVSVDVTVPQQNGTDLAYLRASAARHGFMFEIAAGDTGRPCAYWGPTRAPSG